jgi:hypothetical protein
MVEEVVVQHVLILQMVLLVEPVVLVLFLY